MTVTFVVYLLESSPGLYVVEQYCFLFRHLIPINVYVGRINKSYPNI